jgi:hypothetical protein
MPTNLKAKVWRLKRTTRLLWDEVRVFGLRSALSNKRVSRAYVKDLNASSRAWLRQRKEKENAN